MLCAQMVQKTPAALLHIAPGGIEVPGVPGIGNLPGAAGKVHQQMQSAGGVAAADPLHIPQVGMIHADEQIIGLIVALLQLAGGFSGAVDAMPVQQPADGGIDRVSQLLSAGGCGFNVKFRLQSGSVNHVLHHKFSHGASANISVADKEYTNHTFLLRFLRVFSSIPQNASAVEGDSGHASAIYEPPVCCYNGENNKKG